MTKFNLSGPVETDDGEGKVMKMVDGAPVVMTMAEIIRKAILTNPPDRVLTWAESETRHMLAKKLYGDGEIELAHDQVQLIKNALPLLGQPWVTGEIGAYLEAVIAAEKEALNAAKPGKTD